MLARSESESADILRQARTQRCAQCADLFRNVTVRTWKPLSTHFVISATAIGTEIAGRRDRRRGHHSGAAVCAVLTDNDFRRILESGTLVPSR
jgi:hypothetical protein